MSDDKPNAAPGWYPDGAGGQRYWDGTKWTDQTAPSAAYPAAFPASGAPEHTGKKKKVPTWAWFVIVPAVGLTGICLLGLLGSATDGPDYSKLAAMNAGDFKSISPAEWNAIKKDPAEATGRKVVVFADINQFDQATGEGEFLGDASALQPAEESEYDSNALFRGDPERFTELQEEDVVRVFGVVSGSYSYSNVMGGGNDAVQIDVAIIEKVGLYDLRKDVEILESRPTDGWGDWSVELKVTNSAAERKEYSVTITAKSPDGSKDIEESTGDTSKLEPGQSVTVETSQFVDAPEDSKLVVDDVSRY